MAKQLKNIFSANFDEIAQDFTINSWHVSQSVDAFTGANDYDITVSGSLGVTGSFGVKSLPEVSNPSIQNNVIVIDPISGLIGYTGSFSAEAGSSGSSGTSGTNGNNGSSGSSGTSGNSGSSGSSGNSGSSGSSGADGSSGSSGTSGVGGSSGSSGTSGAGGSSGSSGTSGEVAINNNTDNYVLTATATAAINGEQNLTFNGSKLIVTGDISASGDVVAFDSSDERLKDNLQPITGALNLVKSLKGYRFEWNENQDLYFGKDIGVVAQEIETIFPELVNTRDNGYKAVKYNKLVAVLIQAINELSEKIDNQNG